MNNRRIRLIEEARGNGSAMWRRIAEDLAKSGRNRRQVNLSRIARASKDGEVVVVPGKVLGSGDLPHKVTVAAFEFSESARRKLSEAKCDAMDLEDFLKSGKTGRIIG